MKYVHLLNNRYAIASILSPILAGIIIVTYQGIAHSEYWIAINNANGTHNAEGAMMGIAEVIEIIVALTIGCFTGIIFAIRSIRINKTKIGSIALALNILPFLLLSIFWVKGVIYGI